LGALLDACLFCLVYSSQTVSTPLFDTSSIVLNNKTGHESFELTNSLGAIIYSGKFIEEQHFNSLPNGIYFLKVVDKSTSMIKLLKE
jgi:hypothetical protein